MNRSLIVFILIFFPLIFKGQKFIRLVDSSNVWTIITHYRTTQHHWATYKLRLEKDSLSVDKEYFKIIKTNILKEEVLETDVGFIREDDNGNVYFTKDKEKELLLYSFDVSVDDTICIYNPLSYNYKQQNLIVDSIFEVIIDRKPCRKIVLRPVCVIRITTCWVEGIGDLKGLLNNTLSGITCFSDSIAMFISGGGSEQLSCFEKNQEIIYRNPDFEKCIKISNN